jgi:phytoene dehydrogenase-like protein
MIKEALARRDFLKAMLAGIPLLALDWDALPRGESPPADAADRWDAVIIGGGLGGLSCAAAFARQGFRPLVLEQHSVAGGYATAFRRPGGFLFDASLHSTTVGERGGVHNLIPGFPEIQSVEFVPHKVLYRAIFPEHDIRVPHRDPDGYIRMLSERFPDEKEGLQNLYQIMQGLAADLARYQAAAGNVDRLTFARDYPHLLRCFNSTWGQIQDSCLKNPQLKGIVSGLWGYFGLPPSKLASLYYIMPLMGYLRDGGYYPRGRSQDISDAFVRFIEERRGKVLLGSRVDSILIRDHAAYGVRTQDGREHLSRAVVSNANAHDTFHTMMNEGPFLGDYLTRMDGFRPSLSCFQVFLGLNKDLIKQLGITDTEIFYETSYDTEEGYRSACAADVEKGGFGLTLYDNLYKGYSPEGKNTLSIIILQGYDHWQSYEDDYFSGRKDAYRAEKERLADIMIRKVEATLMPGLREAIAVREVATPLTNVRYTRNYRGAIYGWEQVLDNSTPRRLPHKTPIGNLYLAGAWTRPGGGYGAVIPSGLECFGEIMQDWAAPK